MAASNLYTHQDENIAKTWILMALFFCVVIGIGWALSYYFDNIAILMIVTMLAFAMNVGAYWWSDKVVVATSRAVPADPVRYSELHHVVENLAITAGLPKPKIYIVDDPQPNAFSTGRNKDH